MAGFPSLTLLLFLLFSSLSSAYCRHRPPPPSPQPHASDPSCKQVSSIIEVACKASRDPAACGAYRPRPPPPPPPQPHAGDPSSKQVSRTIEVACKASRYPAACGAWLSHSGLGPQNATILQVIQSALQVTSQNLKKGRAMVQDILNTSAGNKNRTTAATTCLEMVNYSDYRINLVVGALARGRLKDARAWMSAALVYQYDCWSALAYVDDTSKVVETMTFFNSTLIAGSSSTLGMLVNYDLHGERHFK